MVEMRLRGAPGKTDWTIFAQAAPLSSPEVENGLIKNKGDNVGFRKSDRDLSRVGENPLITE